MKPLPRDFYARNTVTVAKELLGKTLVRKINSHTISGIITETEAYRYADDPASHAYRGITERNKAMFGEVGRSYVYFTYGMYYCVNAVARSKSYDAGAVLIRAVKPDQGIEIMIKNRTKKKISELSNGPAKLTQAMKITKKQYGVDLTKPGELFIAEGLEKQKIQSSNRIGIKDGIEKLWNFKIEI
ncbi:MAG: DNA-3-methyladenine glycosylase [Nitrosopumilaceae archaeon]|nr:DNA-3-methyladenine glycosylase [Nitrosopumilaceae archaeon]